MKKKRERLFELLSLRIKPELDGWRVTYTYLLPEDSLLREFWPRKFTYFAESPPVALGYAQHAIMGWFIE